MFRVSFSSDLLDKSWSRRRVNYVGDRRSYLHDYPENARDGRWRRRTYRDGGGWILIQRRRGTDQEGVSSRKFSGEEDRCGECIQAYIRVPTGQGTESVVFLVVFVVFVVFVVGVTAFILIS